MALWSIDISSIAASSCASMESCSGDAVTLSIKPWRECHQYYKPKEHCLQHADRHMQMPLSWANIWNILMLLTSCFVCWKNGACIILWRPMPACLCPQSLVLCILPFVLLQMARDHYYSSWPKGFGISLVPLVGETIITAVPRHTCACQRWSHPGDANVTSPWLLIDAVLWNACNVDYRSDCIMSRCMSWMQLTTRPRLLVWSDILSGSSGSVHADIAQE